ncbi:MAG TPA: alpha/beta fold hydrolase [Gemmatimonadaceae bacterium]|nr:alpha/beta fold hydrolase [Gemmatimonadaceae bacterium]
MTMHPPGTHVHIGDTRLWVEREGEGEPLLLLAGGPANSHLTFHPAFSALADEYEVIYVDYRGRGRSDPVTDYRTITFERDVADIEALRDALGLERMHVYGFSYGGMVAQAYALAHPDRVGSLILANTVHSPEMWQRNHENINREIANQFPEVWDEILRLRAVGVRSTAPEMQALYKVHAPLVRFYNPDNAAKLLSEPGSRNMELYTVFAGDDIEFFLGGEVARLPDFRPRLAELAMPLLVIAGRYDRALYPAYQREFARYAPRAELVMMERSGSFAHLEEPEALMALVRRFLASTAEALISRR